MTTGRIDYAPDYKSEKPDAALAQLYQAATPSELSAVVERKRLRDAVVEAAKVWSTELSTITSTTYTLDEADRLRRAAHTKLERVVDGLREFEAKQEPEK